MDNILEESCCVRWYLGQTRNYTAHSLARIDAVTYGTHLVTGLIA